MKVKLQDDGGEKKLIVLLSSDVRFKGKVIGKHKKNIATEKIYAYIRTTFSGNALKLARLNEFQKGKFCEFIFLL